MFGLLGNDTFHLKSNYNRFEVKFTDFSYLRIVRMPQNLASYVDLIQF